LHNFGSQNAQQILSSRDNQNFIRDAINRIIQLRDERNAARDERDDALNQRDSFWNFILKQFFGD
jgi:hypothetical protein